MRDGIKSAGILSKNLKIVEEKVACTIIGSLAKRYVLVATYGSANPWRILKIRLFADWDLDDCWLRHTNKYLAPNSALR
jgi:hypothetical protein